MTSHTAAQLEKEEGRKHAVYQDHLGFWTIGVGFLVDGRKGGGLRDEEIDFILANRIKILTAAILEKLDWANRLEEPRFAVLLGMAFQMGLDGLLEFKKALAAMRDEHWALAASEMKDSEWAEQTPERAKRMARQMESGEWQS